MKWKHLFNQPLHHEDVHISTGPAFTIGARSIERYNAEDAIAVGVAQGLVGALCIYMNVVAIKKMGSMVGQELGYGLWNGILFILVGTTGAASGLSKNACLVFFYTVFCLFSASLLSSSLIITAAVDTYYTFSKAEISTLAKAPPAALIILGMLEAMLDIFGLFLGCHAVCGCHRRLKGRVINRGPRSGFGKDVYTEQSETSDGEVPTTSGVKRLPPPDGNPPDGNPPPDENPPDGNPPPDENPPPDTPKQSQQQKY